MKILKVTLLTLSCLFASTAFAQTRRTPSAPPLTQAVSVDAQTGNNILCKNLPVPDGFAISGEMFADSCNGAAWIVRPKSAPPRSLDQTANRFSSTDGAAFAEPNEAIAAGQCDAFMQTVRTTYNFNPAQFNDAQRNAASAKLDDFWGYVRQSSAKLMPCLRQALKSDKSGSFFGIDGSMLLVEVDPSRASKALQVRKFTEADLDGADLEYWVKTMAKRGVEGFDTSEAGAKWLSYPKAKYELSLHGGYPIGSFLGAVFIFGSMDENFATPVLLRIANDVSHPHRDDAIAILSSQVTPAALNALRQINPAGLSAQSQKALQDMKENRDILKPRVHPKLTREENLRAFQGIIDGDYSAFREMVMKVPDGEVDAIATLRPEDIPILRRARRASISRCNQHAVSDYASFTAILAALVQ
jgi:hypothetical protein